jgi:hypothetical protein
MAHRDPAELESVELLPEDVRTLTADEELAAYDDILDYDPELDRELAEEAIEPFGRSWDFDFNARRFQNLGMGPAQTTGLDSLRMWVYACLNTAKDAHPIFDEDFGVEGLDDMIGQPWDAELAGRYRTAVRDALLQHDRITDVDGFHFNHNDLEEWVEVTFVIVVDDDEEVDFTAQVAAASGVAV